MKVGSGGGGGGCVIEVVECGGGDPILLGDDGDDATVGVVRRSDSEGCRPRPPYDSTRPSLNLRSVVMVVLSHMQCVLLLLCVMTPRGSRCMYAKGSARLAQCSLFCRSLNFLCLLRARSGVDERQPRQHVRSSPDSTRIASCQ